MRWIEIPNEETNCSLSPSLRRLTLATCWDMLKPLTCLVEPEGSVVTPSVVLTKIIYTFGKSESFLVCLKHLNQNESFDSKTEMCCLLCVVSIGIVHGCWILHVQLCPGWRACLWTCQKSRSEVCAAPGNISNTLRFYKNKEQIKSTWSSLHSKCIFQVFAETKDELALVLFGTDSTNNPLDQDGQYQNITVHRHLMLPDFELLEEIENQIHPESQQADCILLRDIFI